MQTAASYRPIPPAFRFFFGPVYQAFRLFAAVASPYLVSQTVRARKWREAEAELDRMAAEWDAEWELERRSPATAREDRPLSGANWRALNISRLPSALCLGGPTLVLPRIGIHGRPPEVRQLSSLPTRTSALVPRSGAEAAAPITSRTSSMSAEEAAQLIRDLLESPETLSMPGRPSALLSVTALHLLLRGGQVHYVPLIQQVLDSWTSNSIPALYRLRPATASACLNFCHSHWPVHISMQTRLIEHATGENRAKAWEGKLAAWRVARWRHVLGHYVSLRRQMYFRSTLQAPYPAEEAQIWWSQELVATNELRQKTWSPGKRRNTQNPDPYKLYDPDPEAFWALPPVCECQRIGTAVQWGQEVKPGLLPDCLPAPASWPARVIEGRLIAWPVRTLIRLLIAGLAIPTSLYSWGLAAATEANRCDLAAYLLVLANRATLLDPHFDLRALAKRCAELIMLEPASSARLTVAVDLIAREVATQLRGWRGATRSRLLVPAVIRLFVRFNENATQELTTPATLDATEAAILERVHSLGKSARVTCQSTAKRCRAVLGRLLSLLEGGSDGHVPENLSNADQDLTLELLDHVVRFGSAQEFRILAERLPDNFDIYAPKYLILCLRASRRFSPAQFQASGACVMAPEKLVHLLVEHGSDSYGHVSLSDADPAVLRAIVEYALHPSATREQCETFLKSMFPNAWGLSNVGLVRLPETPELYALLLELAAARQDGELGCKVWLLASRARSQSVYWTSSSCAQGSIPVYQWTLPSKAVGAMLRCVADLVTRNTVPAQRRAELLRQVWATNQSKLGWERILRKGPTWAGSFIMHALAKHQVVVPLFCGPRTAKAALAAPTPRFFADLMQAFVQVADADRLQRGVVLTRLDSILDGLIRLGYPAPTQPQRSSRTTKERTSPAALAKTDFCRPNRRDQVPTQPPTDLGHVKPKQPPSASASWTLSTGVGRTERQRTNASRNRFKRRHNLPLAPRSYLPSAEIGGIDALQQRNRRACAASQAMGKRDF